MRKHEPKTPSDSPTIALLSPSGWGNLGDAAIVDAVIEQIRDRFPRAKIVGITLNPADTLHRHGLDAMTLRGFSSHGYGNREPVPTSAVSSSATKSNDGASEPRRRLTTYFDFALPLKRLLDPVKKEVRHLRRSTEFLKSVDMLVICGGGQLDDYWGGTWGQPYVLYKWGYLARRAGARVIVLGVGTGTLRTVCSRLLVRRFLSGAEFRSYRDTGSRDLVGSPRLTAGDTVGPDLAFALNTEPYKVTKRPPSDTVHVAISPMSWLDPRIWPDKNQSAYDQYVSLLADFAARLVGLRHRVTLFATDDADERTIADVLSLLRERSPEAANAVNRPQTGSVKNLMTLLADSDLVVASRLHGVLLSCLMEIPTVALSYDRKVTALMADMRMSSYCRELAGCDAATLSALFDQTVADRDVIRGILRERVRENRRLLAEQFDRVFGAMPVPNKVRA